jgi:hypothetical protein
LDSNTLAHKQTLSFTLETILFVLFALLMNVYQLVYTVSENVSNFAYIALFSKVFNLDRFTVTDGWDNAWSILQDWFSLRTNKIR